MKMTFNHIEYTLPFKKDLKRLLKRFGSLEEDLEVFIKVQLKLFHKLHQDNDGIKEITGLKKDHPFIYKARKFACRSLKGKGAKSGIRLIYSYIQDRDTIEFIEMYYKGDKENEDRERINQYLNQYLT